MSSKVYNPWAILLIKFKLNEIHLIKSSKAKGKAHNLNTPKDNLHSIKLVNYLNKDITSNHISPNNSIWQRTIDTIS